MAKSPTQRSLEKLRAEGWTVDVVERWIPGMNIRRDLFTILDLLALRDGVTMGVQTTSYSNVSARIRKVGDCEHLPAIRNAGWKLVIHGWRKAGRAWVCREVDVS